MLTVHNRYKQFFIQIFLTPQTSIWWKISKDDGYLIRNCGLDRTIDAHSEDIILSVYDEEGEFAGILNSASACDVILGKPPYFYGDSN